MKINRQTIFTMFIGVMMLTWAAAMAMSFSIQTGGQNTFQVESVYDRLLTPQEKVNILRAGRVLIEYMHTGGPGTMDKQSIYESFVAKYKDFIVLQVVEVSEDNQTYNQMIIPTGDVISLENATEANLEDIFCENTLVQPKECLLKSI